MKVKCKVCEGTGMVPGNFGGGTDSFHCKKKCPACDGSGMQTCDCGCDCKRRCYPYYPWNPYTPTWNPPYYVTCGQGTGGASTTTTSYGSTGQFSYTTQ